MPRLDLESGGYVEITEPGEKELLIGMGFPDEGSMHVKISSPEELNEVILLLCSHPESFLSRISERVDEIKDDHHG